MGLYQNKYRIDSSRLKEWDYTNAAWYYITVNLKKHAPCFGKIIKGKMALNDIGEIVKEEWLNTEKVRKHIELDYYQIMPNHLHGIIIFNDYVETTRLPRHFRGWVVSPRIKHGEMMHRIVSTTLKPNSLGSMIGQFKSVCTKRIHAAGYELFSWQPRFYDHIVRTELELYNIRKYILENPRRWEIEKDNPENIGIF